MFPVAVLAGLNKNIFNFLVAMGTTALMTITAVNFGKPESPDHKNDSEPRHKVI